MPSLDRNSRDRAIGRVVDELEALSVEELHELGLDDEGETNAEQHVYVVVTYGGHEVDVAVCASSASLPECVSPDTAEWAKSYPNDRAEIDGGFLIYATLNP